jgi:hypothetical protein
LDVQEHPTEGTAPKPRVRRPPAVTFVGALALALGAYHVVAGVAVVVDGGTASQLSEGALDIALGAFAVVIARGALRMRSWAWAAFMTWAVVGLTHQLLRHFFYHDPNYVAMALDTIAVLALTPLEIQVAFGVRPRPNMVLERATRNPVDGG